MNHKPCQDLHYPRFEDLTAHTTNALTCPIAGRSPSSRGSYSPKHRRLGDAGIWISPMHFVPICLRKPILGQHHSLSVPSTQGRFVAGEISEGFGVESHDRQCNSPPSSPTFSEVHMPMNNVRISRSRTAVGTRLATLSVPGASHGVERQLTHSARRLRCPPPYCESSHRVPHLQGDIA